MLLIADGDAKRALGIAATTPDRFEAVHAGEAFPRLPYGIADTVLIAIGTGARGSWSASRARTGSWTRTALATL